MDSKIGFLNSQTKWSEEEGVKIFVSQMLTSRVFLGDFQERRYVDLIENYRDVIVIDQQHEELKHDLDIVKKRLDDFYEGQLWIGITGPNMIGAPSGHCFWVKSQDQPLGKHWFIINKVNFLPNEVIVKLKKIRMPTEDSNSTSKDGVEREDGFVGSEIADFFKILSVESARNVFTKQLAPTLLSTFTYQNIKNSALFLSVLFLALVTGLMNSIQFLAEYSILFFREFNNFIVVMTPFMLGVLELISKVIGGTLLLLAMMWRSMVSMITGDPGPPVGAPNFMALNQKQQLRLPPAQSEDKTYADLRHQNQMYQNHDRNRWSAYSRR